MNPKVINKCNGGIREVYLIPVEETIIPEPETPDGIFDNGDGTFSIKMSWQEIKTEDADFEIIQPKELPNAPNLPSQ